MSEEEIIKQINKDIIKIQQYMKSAKKFNYKNAEKIYEKQLQSIQGLLDLYNKEKEKNKILDIMLLVNKEQYEFIKNKDNYISKDKIKEKIEELENEDLVIHDDIDSEDVIIAKYEQIAVLDFCEELLEERN